MNRFLLSIIVLFGVFVCVETSAQTDPSDLDEAFTKAAQYEWGESRAALSEIEFAVVEALDEGDPSAALERRLIELFRSEDATLGAKDFACRQLRLIGTARCVPALGAKLADSELGAMASYALAAIPGEEAADMLLCDRIGRLLAVSDKGDVSARETLGSMRDRGIDDILSDLVLLAEPKFQIEIAGLLGERGAREHVETLKLLAKDDQPASVRVAAYLALAKVGDWRDEVDRAGFYRQAMRIAPGYEEQFNVLVAIAAYGDPGLIDVAQSAMNTGVISVTAAEVVIQLALAGEAANRPGAKAAIQGVLERFPGHLMLRMQAGEALSHIERNEGFITQWMISGPYLGEESGEEGMFSFAYLPEHDQAAAEWATVPDDAYIDPGEINFMGMFGGDNRCAYALTFIICQAAQNVQLQIGSDDGVKVWLNGVIVHTNDAARGLTLNEDTAPMQLRAGRNELLVKITQGGGDWRFAARLRDADGFKLSGVDYLRPKK